MAGEFGLSALKTFVNYAALLAVLVIICVKGCPVEEREALLNFRASLNDSSDHLKSWEGVDCCKWRGVKCYGEAKHVGTLDLHGFQLSTLRGGQIDSSLFQLRQLRYLDLSLNSVEYIQIPPSLGLLKKLRYLNMSYAGFGGAVPSELGNLSSLRYLDLSSSSYSALYSLDLEWVRGMSYLKYLSLDCIGLNTISTEFSNLSQLTHLGLSACDLQCSFPLSLLNLSSLVFLDLRSNLLFSTSDHVLFDIFCHLRFLTHLDLFENPIGGSIPRSIGNLSSLNYLDLSLTNLSGEIPSTLGTPSTLAYLRHIPLGLCADFLDISSNDIVGNIPVSLTDCQGLAVLNIASNQLEGFIPEEFGKLQSLNSLHIENNNLRGSIPSTLSNCKQLRVLDLGNNAFSGNIPSWIANLSKLQVLSMRSNYFGGKIPSEIGQLSNLQVLDLYANILSATIPPTIFNLSTMKQVQPQGGSYKVGTSFRGGSGGLIPPSSYYEDGLELTAKDIDQHYKYVLSGLTCIDVSNNHLRGHLPLEIGKLKGLMIFNVSKNHLSGPIPKCLGDLRQLESLDLSTNNFSGQIPKELQFLDSLGALNLSNNKLSGKIPRSGHMLTFEESSFVGNLELCGDPLKRKCSYKVPQPNLLEEGQEESDSKEDVWWSIGVGLSYGLGFAGVISMLAVQMQWRKMLFEAMDGFIDFIFMELFG
eukprot:Gb_33036 [translate_table: standard]